jgi:hypothetical protein
MLLCIFVLWFASSGQQAAVLHGVCVYNTVICQLASWQQGECEPIVPQPLQVFQRLGMQLNKELLRVCGLFRCWGWERNAIVEIWAGRACCCRSVVVPTLDLGIMKELQLLNSAAASAWFRDLQQECACIRSTHRHKSFMCAWSELN